MNWESLDWEILDRLRENFLSGRAAAGPYWHTMTDLECYDFTFGERIGWKWDAVLDELARRHWAPRTGATADANAPRTLLDWGCGSGIAGRRVAGFFPAGIFDRMLVHDHSALAVDFAVYRGRQLLPGWRVEPAGKSYLTGDEPIGLLVVSHVLNELDPIARAELTGLAARAQSILWVEPGTHEVSRALGGWRERLRATGLAPVAPCPHRGACGILAAGNERHWCHFFAAPPAGVYADSGWVKFGQRAGIDLRSLPYSFLALDRTPPPAEIGGSRVIGAPRIYKGYAKIFNCDAGGTTELVLQKRDAPGLFKALKQGEAPLIQHWTHAGGRIEPAAPT